MVMGGSSSLEESVSSFAFSTKRRRRTGCCGLGANFDGSIPSRFAARSDAEWIEISLGDSSTASTTRFGLDRTIDGVSFRFKDRCANGSSIGSGVGSGGCEWGCCAGGRDASGDSTSRSWPSFVSSVEDGGGRGFSLLPEGFFPFCCAALLVCCFGIVAFFVVSFPATRSFVFLFFPEKKPWRPVSCAKNFRTARISFESSQNTMPETACGL
mmetsp:Transcript_7431/g.24507  ORF Transcript_7431/g.24507 Transcript_7431/m.24507 type:complete len:212 (-) Transcript_7431:68-703(-)